MAKRTVIDNPDHYIADAAGMDRENIYGWQVQTGKTFVELKNGTTGTIKHWLGGHFVLDNGVHGFRDDVIAFR